jgi:hypothetical protein
MTTSRPPIPTRMLAKLRLTCLELPEVTEEDAWVGTRWNVARKNFAHVLMIAESWPPAYAKAAGTGGPACVVTFRLPQEKLAAERFRRRPYFRPVWFPNIAGMFLDAATDWDEVAIHLIESYRVLAPQKLRAALDERG